MVRYGKWNGAYNNGKMTPEFKSWNSMMERCNNPRGHHKKYYKGINICDQWYDFEVFLSDMGIRPPNTTLDRIDNKGNYEPGNCRWATKHEQNNNQRKNVVLNIGDFTGTVIEWCNALHLPAKTIYKRLEKGYAPYEALFTPIVRHSNQHLVKRDNEAI